MRKNTGLVGVVWHGEAPLELVGHYGSRNRDRLGHHVVGLAGTGWSLLAQESHQAQSRCLSETNGVTEKETARLTRDSLLTFIVRVRVAFSRIR
jgi:hypothetical protein